MRTHVQGRIQRLVLFFFSIVLMGMRASWVVRLNVFLMASTGNQLR
jgi:hypothetical protein